MDQREIELPFANLFIPIVREIVDQTHQSVLRERVVPQAQELEEHVREIRERGGKTRKQTSDAILTGVEFYAGETIAYMFVHTKLFSRWEERDKRYLLFRALEKDIMWEESWEARGTAEELFYGVRQYGSDGDSRALSVAKLRGLQNRLSERVTLTPTPWRR